MKVKEWIKRMMLLAHVDPVFIKKVYRVFFKKKTVVYNVNKTNYNKKCLLQYIVSPFLVPVGTISESHQNQWQVRMLAQEIGSFGYDVDVRDFDSTEPLKNQYDLLVDIHPGFNTCCQGNVNMTSSCCRIAYMTGMNTSVATKNEQIRLKSLERRRGVRLPKERQHPPLSREIEQFDAFFFIGNQYNLDSYKEFSLPPVFFIKNNGYTFPWKSSVEQKNSRCFLFLASNGQVHKGLDLLLEVFSQKGFPFELYICSNVYSEKEFCRVYETELFHTSNIHTIGFVDIMSEEFHRLVDVCSFSILPSCSEANAGAVLTAMSAGLIPIVSKEAGFEDDEVIHLTDCELNTIEDTIYLYGMKDRDWIVKESRRTKQVAESRYSRACFIRSVRDALQVVLENRNV